MCVDFEVMVMVGEKFYFKVVGLVRIVVDVMLELVEVMIGLLNVLGLF